MMVTPTPAPYLASMPPPPIANLMGYYGSGERGGFKPADDTHGRVALDQTARARRR